MSSLNIFHLSSITTVVLDYSTFLFRAVSERYDTWGDIFVYPNGPSSPPPQVKEKVKKNFLYLKRIIQMKLGGAACCLRLWERERMGDGVANKVVGNGHFPPILLEREQIASCEFFFNI